MRFNEVQERVPRPQVIRTLRLAQLLLRQVADQTRTILVLPHSLRESSATRKKGRKTTKLVQNAPEVHFSGRLRFALTRSSTRSLRPLSVTRLCGRFIPTLRLQIDTKINRCVLLHKYLAKSSQCWLLALRARGVDVFTRPFEKRGRGDHTPRWLEIHALRTTRRAAFLERAVW